MSFNDILIATIMIDKQKAKKNNYVLMIIAKRWLMMPGNEKLMGFRQMKMREIA